MKKTSYFFTIGLGTVVMIITSLQLIPEQQSYTEEPSLHEIHSKSAFVKRRNPATPLPQEQVPIDK